MVIRLLFIDKEQAQYSFATPLCSRFQNHVPLPSPLPVSTETEIYHDRYGMKSAFSPLLTKQRAY
jgi:hypothetical protein